MASTAGKPVWFNGRVKAVPSGDSLVIVENLKEGIPQEKTITLSSLIAPKLVCSLNIGKSNLHCLLVSVSLMFIF